MKQLLQFLLFVLPIIAFSQCPPDGTFNSQAEIDSFAIDYPDCTILSGSLVISGNDITDLSGLAQITECTNLYISTNLVLQNTDGLNPNITLSWREFRGNEFIISNNASLLEITGLENLVNNADDYSSFSISNNPMLTSLEGIPNTFGTIGSLGIHNNDALINLNGLENYISLEVATISDNDNLIDLTGLDRAFGLDYLRISDNDALESFNGLNQIYGGEQLIIENNPVLADINVTSSGGTNWGELIIRDNPNLSVCNVTWVCNEIYQNAIEGYWFSSTFENNAPGCNSNAEVEYGCELNSNDDCAPADYPWSYHLNLGETLIANNEFATTSFQLPTCNEIENRKDIWFAFYTEDNTTIDLITQAGYSIQIWENGGCHDPTSGPMVGVACGSVLLEDVPVTPETSYLVQVWNDDGLRMPSGWFNILVQDGLLSTPEFEVDEVNIYPNPVQSELHIQSNLPIDTIQVFNLLGQQVIESKATTLDVSNLTEGLYLVKVISNGRPTTYKIIKK